MKRISLTCCLLLAFGSCAWSQQQIVSETTDKRIVFVMVDDAGDPVAGATITGVSYYKSGGSYTAMTTPTTGHLGDGLHYVIADEGTTIGGGLAQEDITFVIAASDARTAFVGAVITGPVSTIEDIEDASEAGAGAALVIYDGLTNTEFDNALPTNFSSMDINVTGGVGLDWANIQNQGTTVDLDATTFKNAADTDTQFDDLNNKFGDPVGADFSFDISQRASQSSVTAIKNKTDFLPSATAGAGGGLFIAGSNAATTVNFTGNLSGSVGSVTGNVLIADGYLTADKFDAGLFFDPATDGVNVIHFDPASIVELITVDSGETAASAGSLAKLSQGVGDAGAIWDEATSGHLAAGSFGKLISDILADTSLIGAPVDEESISAMILSLRGVADLLETRLGVPDDTIALDIAAIESGSELSANIQALIDLVQATLPIEADPDRTWVMRRLPDRVGSEKVIPHKAGASTTLYADVERLLSTGEVIGAVGDIDIDAGAATVTDIAKIGNYIYFTVAGGTAGTTEDVEISFDTNLTEVDKPIVCNGYLKVIE